MKIHDPSWPSLGASSSEKEGGTTEREKFQRVLVLSRAIKTANPSKELTLRRGGAESNNPRKKSLKRKLWNLQRNAT